MSVKSRSKTPDVAQKQKQKPETCQPDSKRLFFESLISPVAMLFAGSLLTGICISLDVEMEMDTDMDDPQGCHFVSCIYERTL